MSTDKKQICLLHPFVGDYFIPENWQKEPKSRNFFARITWNDKTLFDRTFLRGKIIDDSMVFSKNDFVDGDIIEQKCVFIKGKKEETTFHGFFIIHPGSEGIYGEQISQKEALEFFQGCHALPKIGVNEKPLLKAKLNQVVRTLRVKYSPELISEVLMEIMEEILPSPSEANQSSSNAPSSMHP